MALPVYKKKEIETNVYDAAIARFERLFDEFDKVVVSFSGGKDSTVCLNLALEVARRKGMLPLDVYFWDEEAIQPETVEYVQRVAALPDVRFKWLCIPISHRNGCSRSEPTWHPWDPRKPELWCRPLPEGAITELPPFTFAQLNRWELSVPDLAPNVYGPEFGRVADVRGIRADESLRRYRTVAAKLRDNWIGAPRAYGTGITKTGNVSRRGAMHSFPVSPVYDWSAFDVWTAPKMFGWDYNRAYDIMQAAGISISSQRICPPYGEEALDGLWQYKTCWPDLWAKICRRVKGANTAGLYAQTELYGYGKFEPPPGVSWRDWTYRLLNLYPPSVRSIVAANVAALISQHRDKTNRPIDEEKADPITGLSWRYLAMIANRGDLKGRRQGNVTGIATQVREKLGLTVEDLAERADQGRY